MLISARCIARGKRFLDDHDGGEGSPQLLDGGVGESNDPDKHEGGFDDLISSGEAQITLIATVEEVQITMAKAEKAQTTFMSTTAQEAKTCLMAADENDKCRESE